MATDIPGLGAAPSPGSDALLGMLFPLWHLVIGAFVLIALVLSVRRIAARGPSRMTTALLVTGGAIAGLTALSFLFGGTSEGRLPAPAVTQPTVPATPQRNGRVIMRARSSSTGTTRPGVTGSPR